jgi:hypothetical protein
MLNWIARFLVFRVLGGRGLLLLAAVNVVRRILGGRRGTPPGVYEPGGTYQPSQGSSQITQREPR